MDALLNGIYIYGITVIMMIIIAYNMSKKYNFSRKLKIYVEYPYKSILIWEC